MAGIDERRWEGDSKDGVEQQNNDFSSVLQEDGLSIDYNEIIDMEGSSTMASHKTKAALNMSDKPSFTINRSPEKKTQKRRTSSTASLNTGVPAPVLEPLMSTPADDLFQVTNSIRRGSYNGGLGFLPIDMEHEETSILKGKHLKNDKLNKLVDQLEMYQETNGMAIDLELDDQLRTRFFKGRFNSSQFNVEQYDEVDDQIGKYLGSGQFHKHNDNKENHGPYPDPSKNVKKSRIRKKSKAQLKNGNVPVLKPLSNLTNIELRSSETGVSRRDIISASIQKSPRRKFSPKKNIVPIRPAIKLESCNQNIFVVESSTGLLNDATQFGTELNSSNCEGFPLPEDTNEIVQIPTNEDTKSKVQKMAIIKALKNNASKKAAEASVSPSPSPIGFYSKEELAKYHHTPQGPHDDQSPGVQVVNQSVDSCLPSAPTRSKQPQASKKVKWAKDLEW